MSFFEKRSQSPKGQFFADLRGRDKGDFHKCAADPGEIPSGSSSNVSPTAMATATPPATNSAQSASAGGLYGTGAGCAPGAKPPAPGVTDGAKKIAGTSPTDWDFVFPTGFHRPTAEQPDALEAGEERFHSTDAPSADYGTGKGIKQGGTNEGGNFMASIVGGQQMGKHADPSITSGQFWKDRAGEAGDSIRSGAEQVGNTASGIVGSVTSSPVLMTIGAGMLARKGVKAGAGAIKKMKANKALEAAGNAAKAAPKLGLGERVAEGAQKIQRFLRR